MDVTTIRKEFLQFFESKGHTIVPSAPMVIKNDPTLMFTNAGMNQFKDIFLDNAKPKSQRLTDSQKCLRVSGKQNDLEEVGVDTYHHTMFEMLGNWSFGDYFKKEAIFWAWELLTEVYKIDKNRLYITIFEGDKEDGTEIDKEAFDLWAQLIDKDRILEFDKKDNFWEMGDVGPCGPCSEIHVDIRSEKDREAIDGKTLVNKDHPQVIEIWNLVFMEYQRMADRRLLPLSKKHIDTGMGLERLAMVLQGKQSNYDTDIFQPTIQKIAELSGVAYKSSDSKEDVAIRVLSDHVRAIAFSIADGQLPSNTGAGYVIRRILRRAVRYAYSFLDVRESFMYQLVPLMVEQMGPFFPELQKQQDLIERVIREEEESFHRTLDRGIKLFNDYVAESKDQLIDGVFAFELYDRWGFPIDLTELMASEIDFTVDKVIFEQELAVQKKNSRADSKVEANDWVDLMEDDIQEFIGYDHTEAKVYITRYRKVVAKKKEMYQLVFNITPFYAESGGQVGDTGYIEDTDGIKISITNTKKENNLTVHYADTLPANPKKRFKAVVSASKRKDITSNHTATHLLHKALRDVLGTHVEQKGSLVNAKHLRFDFSHFSKLTDEELQQVELEVNRSIRNNIALDERRMVPVQEAMDMGAMALFGEKYGDVVRVIRFGDSVELCGGNHVQSTGEIGLFKIVSEGSVSSGIRRIEALTAKAATEHVYARLEELSEVKALLKNPKDLTKTITDLLEQNHQLQKEMEGLIKEKAGQLKNDLLQKIKTVNGVDFLAEQVDLDAGAIKDIAFQLKGQNDNLFLVLAGAQGEKATLTEMVSEKLVESKSLHAGNIVRELAKSIQGGGGGQPFFATAGGKNPKGIGEALKRAEDYLN